MQAAEIRQQKVQMWKLNKALQHQLEKYKKKTRYFLEYYPAKVKKSDLQVDITGSYRITGYNSHQQK